MTPTELPDEFAIFNEEDPEHGLNLVSLVKTPAIGFMAIKFSKQENFKLAIQSEDKRIIFTPVLIPDQKIYRDVDGYKFNLIFQADTIEKIAIQFAKDHLTTKVDTNHSQQLIEGVTWFESFVLSGERVSAVKGFEGIPLGTWFLSGKVTNDEVWEKIKNDEITGVSIDGGFGVSKKPDHLAAALESLYKKVTK